MPSSMQDFLQTFLNLKQVQNQTEQVAQQARSSAINGMQTFMTLAQHTADPAQLTGLVNNFSRMGVGTTDELTSILSHVTPTTEAQKAQMVRTGLQVHQGQTPDGTTQETSKLATDTADQALTGQNAGQRGASDMLAKLFDKVDLAGPHGAAMALGLATRTATGMSPLDMVFDEVGRAMPAGEIVQAAGAKMGTRLTAAQDATNKLGWGQLRVADRQNTMQSAYQLGNLESENNYRMGQLEVDKAKALATAKGHDPQIIVNLIDAKNKLLASLREAKNSKPSARELASYMGGLNSINAQMASYDLPNEGQIDYNVDDLVKPGFLDNLFAMKPIVIMPQNVKPAGTGRK